MSLIGWDSLGNSNWYIFVILLLYLLTYLSFRLCKNKPFILSVAIVGAAVCIFILIAYHYKIKESYWYDTALCYVLGMGYSLVKPQAEKWIDKNRFTWGASLLAFAVLYFWLHNRSIGRGIVANLAFCAMVVVFTMHITLNNRMLHWCGKHLFEIYILQRIPMIVFSHIGLARINIFLYFFLCLAVTVGLVYVFHMLVLKLSGAFVTPYKVNK